MLGFKKVSGYVLLFCIGFCSGCAHHGADVSGELPPIVTHTKVNKPSEDLGVFLVGDTLELFVKEDATLNGSYPVRDGGYIVIPRVGRITVVGLNRSDAEAKVKISLQHSQLTEATVLVERTSKQALITNTQGASAALPKIMLYITGAVPQPGTHFVPLAQGRSLGLYEALLITGGLNRLAQEQRIELLRVDSSGRRQRAVFDLRPVRQGLAQDPAVGEGDLIIVPEKVFGF